MSVNTLNSKKIVHNKIAIIIFSAVALLFGSMSDIINCISIFGEIIKNFTWQYSWIYIISLVSGIIGIVFTILPCVLLVVYVLFLAKKANGRFLLAAVFASLMYPILKDFVTYFVSHLPILIYSGGFDFLDMIKTLFSFPLVSAVLIKLPLLLSVIMAIVGVKKNIFYILPLSISMYPLINEAVSYINTFIKLIIRVDTYYDSLLYTVIRVLWIIGGFAIHIAVMLFVCENTSIFGKQKAVKQDENTENMSSEEAFSYLGERLDNGDITAEEYQAQREIIVNKM